MATLYHVLNYAFFIAHNLLILFVLTGWLWCRARPWHLGLCVLTGLSWTLLGLIYGWGYCPLTDWHWQIREQLDYQQDPNSYLKLLFDSATGLSANAVVIDVLAVISLIAAAALNVGLMLMSRRGRATKIQAQG